MSGIIAWLKGLSMAGRIGLGVTSLATVSAIGGVTTPPAETLIPQEQIQVQQVEPIETKKTLVEEELIPFEKTTQEDSSLASGTTSIIQSGVNGKRTITYEATYEEGRLISKNQVSSIVNLEPVSEITAVGTYVAPAPEPEPEPATSCDPNYSGCVPIASDVDCAGGSGNGPAYVRGPVTVIGSDIYGLDRDNDGIGCE